MTTITVNFHIVVAEPSDVIRRGICSILSGPGDIPVTLTEVSRPGSLGDVLARVRPDVVIVNSSFSAVLPPSAIKKMLPAARCVMLQSSPGDISTAHLYHDMVSPWNSAPRLRERILPALDPAGSVRHYEPLSQREKDIVVCVVKGMTNMQIAERLHLSHHTVGTHRRNISSKLDIHSTSGLTVYAISNKLIRLDEIDY